MYVCVCVSETINHKKQVVVINFIKEIHLKCFILENKFGFCLIHNFVESAFALNIIFKSSKFSMIRR